MSWWDDFIKYYLRPSTDFLTMGLSELGWNQYDKQQASNKLNIQDILNNAQETGDYLGAQGQLANSGYELSSEQEKWLDNMISNQNTQSARDYETNMSNTDLLRAANQLQQLGLSSSGVLQTGGSSSNLVGAADNVKSNVALERYQQRMALAKQLLSMTSSMASAGVYGHAIGAARKASATISAQAAHSARMITYYDADDHRKGRTISEYLPDDYFDGMF